MWYALKAWNQETRYGWTQDAKIADAACDYWNRGKDIGHYHAYPLTDDEVTELGLEAKDDLAFTDDTYIDQDGDLHFY